MALSCCLVRIIIYIKYPLYTRKPVIKERSYNKVSSYEDIDEQKHEEFAVPKANTVVDPRAVMVHVQHTPVASRAVMASLRLEYIAHQAVPPSFILRVSQVEAPEYRHLSWVCEHGLEEGPNEEYEDHVECDQQHVDTGVFCTVGVRQVGYLLSTLGSHTLMKLK